MNWGLAGQLTVVVILLGWYPVYRTIRPVFVRLRLRRLIRQWNSYTYQRDHTIALEIDRAWDRTYGRARLIKAVKSDLQRDSGFQQRARRAEALGFMDSFEDEPKRSA